MMMMTSKQTFKQIAQNELETFTNVYLIQKVLIKSGVL